MKDFAFSTAHSVDDAAHAAASGARPIAGGTNLLDLMKLQIETPNRLVSVRRLPRLDRVTVTDEGGVRIGAEVTNAALAAHPLIRQRYPLLSRAILAGASAQIRNMATTGGNLLQRTRCVQFYDMTDACNKRQPGSGCGARMGGNRMNAIIGGSEACIAVNPSDMSVALRVLDATVHVQDATGRVRAIPVASFHLLPGETPERETALQPGEIITEISLPPPPMGVHHYRKVRDRTSYAFALISVGAVADIREGRIVSARFAFGGIAPRPWRVEAAEAAMANRPAEVATIEHACDIALEGAKGYGDNDFKILLARRTLVATLLT
ncbi:molybdopterin dehydrogenase, FAD-binding protein [Gluconobacter thailandicus F149-1 = NBRC 100600]|uniref:Xanthine dehydrogenase XdhA n=1 Tax=Gluconobacter thailandicus NBRC 3257 TaxID=1381097 RepID=A0ABQ0IU02_GLUTH|nr:FAD binding domain-containing protein [Gluconobacter thailandicus]GAN91563.1 molybdopterin dehydrogenase, FAD-binding protein [Gluconobacter frateurii M-2]KXV54953.1 xanthine dehydrogenase [Gluconobacter thailandicus]GAD25690.1 xanthine dehydrogenase XdhA [Gluconobacter thailandicus NBRC 3257]GAN94720.1 molybdopterin dehydrogenase, FAD-binding protein [Gluconobacter thailandicus F149-1 = NBRC 100600]GBR60120.1 oxidoreductase [Gluconobacter thailandicus F149-1 = NBRC 100600]